MEGIKKVLAPICSILFILLLIISCSAPSSYVEKEPVKGIYHRVKKGETFSSIARAYRVKMQDLAEINNIQDPNLIEEGSVIFIPEANEIIDDVLAAARKTDTDNKAASSVDRAGGIKSSREASNNGKDVKGAESVRPAPKKTKVAKLKPHEEPVKAADSSPVQKRPDEKNEQKSKLKSGAEEQEDAQLEKKRFIWPVQGSVKTNFGIQPGKTYHNWIKIVSAPGNPVKAADTGTVIFSAPLKDYGKTIIVRHQKGYATVYTHLKKIIVKTDQKIKKGDVIANIGETDEAGDTYMNFEVRLHGKARNPLLFLP